MGTAIKHHEQSCQQLLLSSAVQVLQEHEAAGSLPGDGAGSSMAGGDQAEDVPGQQVGAAMQEDQVVAQPSAQGVGTAVASAAPGPVRLAQTGGPALCACTTTP